LDISTLDNPWPYHQVENFFTLDEFQKVYDYMMTLPVYEKGHMLFEFEPDNTYPHPKDITRHSNVGPFITRIVSAYNQEIKDIFDFRFKKFLDSIDLDYSSPSRFFQYKLSIQSPDTGWNLIHEDLPPKVYNLMIHISKTGVGTVLYTSKNINSFVKYTDWIPNGGQGWDVDYDSGYWHDVTNLGNQNYRYVIRLMLLDKNLKRPDTGGY